MISFSIPKRRKVQTLEAVTICDICRVFSKKEGRREYIWQAQQLHCTESIVQNDVWLYRCIPLSS